MFFEYITNVYLVSVCRAQLKALVISGCWAQRVGKEALAMNNYYYIMAAQSSQLMNTTDECNWFICGNRFVLVFFIYFS